MKIKFSMILFLGIFLLMMSSVSAYKIYIGEDLGNVSMFDTSTNINTILGSHALTTGFAYHYDLFANRGSGQYLMIAGALGTSNANITLYTSSNYGVNWTIKSTILKSGTITESSASGSAKALCMSGDGKYQYYIYSVTTGVIQILHSSDYGATFTNTTIAQASVNGLNEIGCSNNGKYVVITFYITGTRSYLRASNNYATDFNYVSLTNTTIETFNNYRPYINDAGTEIITGAYSYNIVSGLFTSYYYQPYQNNGYIFSDDNGVFIADRYNAWVKSVIGSIGVENNFVNLSQSTASSTTVVDGIIGFNELYMSVNNTKLYSYNTLTGWSNLINYTKQITSISASGNLTINASPQCIDTSTYCSNPFYAYGELGCDYADITYCNNGCVGSTCYNTINNTCNINGARLCTDTTHYATCSDSDGDTALDYGSVTACAIGEYCVASFNYADCFASNSSGTHSVYGLQVLPYKTNSDETTYKTSSNNPKEVAVYTSAITHSQNFYDTGTSYVSRSCDYKETKIYYSEQIFINNETLTDFTSSVADDTVIRLKILPDAQSNGSITIRDSATNSKSIIRYARNVTDKSMCFYYNNGSLIYCDYDTGLGDTLTNVGLEYTFSQSASVYTIRFDFYRSYTSSIILSPQPYTASDFSDIRFNGSMSVNLISLYTIPQFTAFASASTSFPLPCVYDVTGSYVVRTYGNNNGEPDYAIFQDNTIIVNELGLTENQVENIKNNQLIGDTLQTSTKYIIVLVTLIFIIGAFVTIGFSIGQVQGSFVVGVLLSIFALVMFTVFGWIPAWILVFLIICAGATLILVSKLPSGGSAG